MLRAIALFELKYHVKSPLFILGILVFFLMAFGMMLEADFGSSNAVYANAPYVVMQMLLMFSMFGTLSTAAFVVNSVHRDFELNTDALFFSRPIKKWQYIAGRFAGSFTASLLIYLGAIAAILITPLTPFMNKAQLGPYDFVTPFFSLVVLVLPNLLFIGAVLFAVVILTRSLMATYATMAVMALLYAVSMSLAWNIEQEMLASLSDPFGIVTFFRATRYWTIFEKNTRLIALDGLFLWNRLLWLSIGATFLAIAYATFDFTRRTGLIRRGGDESAEDVPVGALRVPEAEVEPRPFAQFRAIVKREAIVTMKSVPFVVIMLCAVFMVLGEGLETARFGEPYPVTRRMLDAIAEGFAFFSLMIAGFYAGEVVWRERALKLSEMSDSMPVPTWTQWTAKLTSLLVVIAGTLVAGIVTTLVLQTAKGYYNYELDLYARSVFGNHAIELAMIATLAFALQVYFNHRMAGFVGITVWFVGSQLLSNFDWQHPLYRFAWVPSGFYSDMNGFGHFVTPMFWMTLYWLLGTGLLLTFVHLLWNRGAESTLRQRLLVARQRFGKRVAATMAVLFAGFVSTGCFIYYNTNVLNTWRNERGYNALAAKAEKTYKKYELLPQPRIVAVRANVDIHPERRAVFIEGSYTAVNKSGVPIRELHVTWMPINLTRIEVEVPRATVRSDDRELGYRIYRLREPLPPGASLTMMFRTAWEARGFLPMRTNTRIVENGTFINNADYFPHIGYSSRIELTDDREEYGLPPQPRIRPPHDPKGRAENAFARNTDWLSLDTTVSTSGDQTAIAPGYLQREWTANGRRYFHYKTTSPIRGFWSYLSARYTVKRDQWNGIPIEVYYDAKHPYNVDRMIHAVKKSLDYFTKNFSPYQHKQVRILEFPDYASFAQAFPNTIPWSESLGFITDLRDPNALDYVSYVAAHEVAHQWWGHQLVPANVQGTSMLSESLAQYSALMVLEQEYPATQMKRYLRYELDRYLSLRGNERVGEMPLALVERQGYIHYQKGAVVMYALRDYIGEERVNRALSRFLRDYAFTGPPYRAAVDLVQYFRAEAPPEYQQLITDLFERITLYELETREATVTRRPDGKYAVKLTLAAQKLYNDGRGDEKPAPIDDWIEIGVFTGTTDDALGKTLFAEKRRFTKPVQTFEIVVDEKPGRAGIDPLNKLIDRNPRDNTKAL